MPTCQEMVCELDAISTFIEQNYPSVVNITNQEVYNVIVNPDISRMLSNSNGCTESLKSENLTVVESDPLKLEHSPNKSTKGEAGSSQKKNK